LTPGVKLYGTYKEINNSLQPCVTGGDSWNAVKEQWEESYNDRLWSERMAATARFGVRYAEVEKRRERAAEECAETFKKLFKRW
jgi:hypothetical protein